MERSKLKKAARDLNEALGLKPKIDTTSDDLESLLTQVKGMVIPDKDSDKISEETMATLRELDGEFGSGEAAEGDEESDDENEEEETEGDEDDESESDEEEENDNDESEESEEETESEESKPEKEKKTVSKTNAKKKTAPAKGKTKTTTRPASKKSPAKKAAAAKKTSPVGVPGDGYKGHREGSRRETAHKMIDAHFKKKDARPKDIIEKLVKELGLMETTARAYVQRLRNK